MKFTDTMIKGLLQPISEKGADRKAWGLSISQVVVPFFISTNVIGASHVNPEALGAPLRLAYDKDGTPRFSQSGRPVLRVAKELSDQVRIIRENLAAGMTAHAEAVAKAKPNEYKAHGELCRQVGEAIHAHDRANLQAYLDKIDNEAMDAKQPEKERELVAA